MEWLVVTGVLLVLASLGVARIVIMLRRASRAVDDAVRLLVVDQRQTWWRAHPDGWPEPSRQDQPDGDREQRPPRAA
jgi:LPS sulfotransferase NodH